MIFFQMYYISLLENELDFILRGKFSLFWYKALQNTL